VLRLSTEKVGRVKPCPTHAGGSFRTTCPQDRARCYRRCSVATNQSRTWQADGASRSIPGRVSPAGGAQRSGHSWRCARRRSLRVREGRPERRAWRSGPAATDPVIRNVPGIRHRPTAGRVTKVSLPYVSFIPRSNPPRMGSSSGPTPPSGSAIAQRSRRPWRPPGSSNSMSETRPTARGGSTCSSRVEPTGRRKPPTSRLPSR
jgi:hypothetical protein